MTAIARTRRPPEGAPAWMTTFADMMSLLMCFFVLLMSFAQIDAEKFKQIAGSMKMAFGVQRLVEASAAPMGTSIIAQEYAPGRPTPTPVDDVRQQTRDETRQSIEFTEATAADDDAAGSGAHGQDTPDEQTQTTHPRTRADTERLLQALDDEIKNGMIQIESKGATMVIRIRERGSFPSGTARFANEFLPVAARLREALAEVDGRIVVAGHTDDVPISTPIYRSNWDLSAARAVSVVHELTADGVLAPARFVVEGHGDAHPLVPNDSAENRAMNRRVELTIIQGDTEAEPGTPIAGETVPTNDALEQARAAIGQAFHAGTAASPAGAP